MSGAFTLKTSGDGIAALTFDLSDQKVNIISEPVLDELEEHIEAVSKDKQIRALLIKSGKPSQFIAGADIHRFKSAFDDPSIAFELIKKGHRVFDRLSALSIPTIAVIDGVCLGGGLELALACSFRISGDNPKVSIGLPEVNLGIMPGWGGTQRLPRIVGLEQGLNMILTGKPVNPKKAYKIKLVDAVFPSVFLDEEAEKFAHAVSDFDKQMRYLRRRDERRLRQKLLEGNPFGRALLYQLSKKKVLEKTKGHYPAPLVALDTIREGYSLSLSEGLKKEVAAFSKGLEGEFKTAKNLIKVFFANEAFKKNPGVPEGASSKEVKKGAVIGAGTMGAGIAWLFSYRDLPVRFKDIDWEAIGKGYGSAWGIYKKLMKIRKLNREQALRKFQLMSGTLDFSGFQNADLIIEAATENLELKRKIFKELEEAVPEDAVIATNTSSLTIDELASTFKHPERLVGMHFFNPPNRMPLVEVVAGSKTSPEAVATAVALCQKMKKSPLVVQDCHGFLVNRIFAMAANEAARMLQEGTPMELLEKMLLGFGMPMGPFTLADEVGNDVSYKAFKVFHKGYGERMALPKILEEMEERKLYGKKTGKGFFLYNGRKTENSEIKEIIARIGEKERPESEEGIIDRVTFSMINEAARCLEEKVVSSATNLDMALIYGTGFPPFRAGLLHYADERGIAAIVTRLKQLQESHGERFAPCPLLVEMARSGSDFYPNE